MRDAEDLMDKIRSLPPERLGEVEDFVDFLAARERSLVLARDAAAASSPSFQAIWDNPEDDIYDAL